MSDPVFVYPCNRGVRNGLTRGWHQFEATGRSGIVLCVLCGARPDAPDLGAIWDAGFDAHRDEVAHQKADPEYPLHRRNPYRNGGA